MALALLVQRHYQHLQFVKLLPPQDFGAMRMPRPKGWAARNFPDGIAFEEPAGRTPARRLEIWQAHSPVFQSPLEYLMRSGALHFGEAAAFLAGGSSDDARSLRAMHTVTIAGWPGILLEQTRDLRPEGASRLTPWKHILACAILPGSRAIVLRLEGPGQLTAADDDLVRRMAQALQLVDFAPPQPLGPVGLPHGIRIGLPPALVGSPRRQPLQESHTALLMHGSAWLSVDLVSCTIMPGDRIETFASLLLFRDPRFRAAEIRRLDATTWSCRRRDEALLPAIAYLRTHADGRALLADFRWVGPGSTTAADYAWVDAVWQLIAGKIEFLDRSPSPAFLVQAGAKAVARLPSDLSALIDNEDMNSQWQWYRESPSQQALTRIDYRLDPQSLQGFVDTSHSPPLSDGPQQTCRWTIARDSAGLQYEYSAIRPPESLSQETRIAAGRFQSVISVNGAAIGGVGGPLPGNFVPGPLLAHALSRFPHNPLILTTDSILNPADAASPDLLRLTIEPANDSPKVLATTQPQKLRCWKLTLNGASTSMRWYFDDTGQLYSISFAGDVHLRRLNIEEWQED